MIDIIKVLNANEKEAISLLKGEKDCTITFSLWDSCEGVYANAEDCPWIRYTDDDGNITAQMVVAVRYNKTNDRIEIKTTSYEDEIGDNVWFPLNFCDDISYWSVFYYIEDYLLFKEEYAKKDSELFG